ncbi:hypothetical protein FB471_2493 [Amycolatopsis cihanbeyliensis]|uniref:Uncharacterized protein n=1 Tax=Amycolatopsis cihanbeyliensis TaxID=1128664 RepID=A0A542DI66_AMYCI|nr:hypothetical protein FB471_2493 [Amycolatopsis cihanbeyliensis]
MVGDVIARRVRFRRAANDMEDCSDAMCGVAVH